MLTVEFAPITSWKYNARILGIAISGVGGDCVRQNTACNIKAAMMIITDLRFIGHTCSKAKCRTKIQSNAIVQLESITGMDRKQAGCQSLKIFKRVYTQVPYPYMIPTIKA